MGNGKLGAEHGVVKNWGSYGEILSIYSNQPNKRTAAARRSVRFSNCREHRERTQGLWPRELSEIANTCEREVLQAAGQTMASGKFIPSMMS
jgi:hypothetical protein